MQLFSTVTSKGQVVIPKPIRDQFQIHPFDRISFGIQNKKVVIDLVPSVASMRGFIKTKIKLTDRQLEKAISKAAEDGFTGDI